jgi:tetratricopeptide (TPR) repeat protein
MTSALGDKGQALAYYEQALPLSRQVGDRWGESITCYNMGLIYADLGDLAQAEQLLMRTVELDEAIDHPDLESDRAALEEVRKRLRGKEELASSGGHMDPIIYTNGIDVDTGTYAIPPHGHRRMGRADTQRGEPGEFP